MSQFYDQASLVMVPSGYKSGKIYSQKPLSTSGELSFSRASNATRVNSSGLVEKVRTSEFTYNTDFTNVAWTKQLCTAVADQIANPVNGAVDADLFYPSISGNYRAIIRTIGVSPVEVGISIYAKAGGKNILFFNDSVGTRQVAFDLSAGTYANTSATAISMESLGGGWYRCAFSAVTEIFYMCVSDGTGSSSVTANGTDGIYIWGQQTEYGVPTEFIGVTTTTAVSVGPVSGVPRLDYSGGASCPSLLLEPQRTNLVTYSEQMTLWANGAASVTANATTSPDGYQNADSINNTSDVSTFVTAANGVYTWSLFVKQGTSATASIDMSDGATGDTITTFTFATKTFSGTSAGGSWTSPSTAYQEYGNGWYRISLTATKGAGSSIGYKIVASGTGTTFVWGAQVEAGAYATSYIGPTYSSAVTRVADAASKTGISSLIGQTEGTIFIQVESNEHISELSDGTSTNRIVFYTDGSDYLRNLIRSGGSTSSNIQTNTTIQAGDKIAMAYANNDSVIYKNGVQIGSDTTVTVPATSKVNVGSDYNGGLTSINSVNQFIVFKTRLSNADLATLTTL